MPFVRPTTSCWRTVSNPALLAEERDELELAVLDDVAAHDLQRRVAVLVERPGPERAVHLLRVGDRLAHGLAVLLAGLGERVERHLGGDVAIDGVGFGHRAVLL